MALAWMYLNAAGVRARIRPATAGDANGRKKLQFNKTDHSRLHAIHAAQTSFADKNIET